jgi:hypothetical protein
VFLLVALVAIGCGWWVEHRAKGEMQSRVKRTNIGIQQIAEMSGYDVHEQDGVFVLSDHQTNNNLGKCPNCGKFFRTDGDISQFVIEESDGSRSYGWRRTGTCKQCNTRFGFVIMPSDAPNRWQWAPIEE